MTTSTRRIALRLTAALAAACASASLAGCAFFTVPTPDPAPDPDSTPRATPQSTPDPATGTRPSGIPDDRELTPDEAEAVAVAAALADTGREWLTAWDESGCTGERAAEDDRPCQIMLMDLADGAQGAADVLADKAEVLAELTAAAEAARATADAATAWLDGWCGAYADPACAAPGVALVDAQRAYDTVMDAWLTRETPDA